MKIDKLAVLNLKKLEPLSTWLTQIGSSSAGHSLQSVMGWRRGVGPCVVGGGGGRGHL